MNSRLYFLHAISPLHLGTGAAVGAIDLPHSREVATGLPNAPGSGVKGVLRDDSVGANLPHRTVLFGQDWQSADQDRTQAALLFSDALILCMPVISLKGDFAWVTSPLALARFARERKHCIPGQANPGIPTVTVGKAAVAADSALVHTANAANSLYLHDLRLSKEAESADAWAKLIADHLFTEQNGQQAFHSAFTQRFAIVRDSDFAYFSEACTDVRTRNRLDENKTVEDGALWSEENMPAESIFWGTVAADTIQTRLDNVTHQAADNLTRFAEYVGATGRSLQLGGKASVGRGMTRFLLTGGGGA